MYHKLEEIIIKTREDLTARKQQLSLDELKDLIDKQLSRPFTKAIKNPKNGSIAIIAEVKLASLSENDLGTSEDIQTRVRKYEQTGVDAISVVTEKHFFKGDAEFVGQIKSTVSLPVLQKDFILDPYQLYEAKIAGADAILLIARILSEEKLISLVNEAKQIGVEPVVEVQSIEDIKKAQVTETEIIAVNARDLDTFEVNVDKACEFLREIPSSYIRLGFSGVSERTDAEKYKNAGANGILIGTSLMKAENIPQFLERIRV